MRPPVAAALPLRRRHSVSLSNTPQMTIFIHCRWLREMMVNRWQQVATGHGCYAREVESSMLLMKQRRCMKHRRYP